MHKLEPWHYWIVGATMLAWYMWRAGQVELLWLLNAVLCLIVMWSCVCRFAVMDKKGTVWDWRERYVLIFFAAACSFMEPWLVNEKPGFVQILTWIAMIRLIEVNGGMWRYGVPDYARTDRKHFRAG